MFASIRDFTQCSTNTGSFYRQLEQIALTGFHTFSDSGQCLVHFGLITTFFQTFQVLDLLFTNSSIVYFKNINRIFFFKTILIYTDNGLRSAVDTCLCTGSRFFDTHFRNTGLDSLCHTSQLLDFLNMLPSTVSQFIGQRFHIIRSTPRVYVLADISLFLNIDLSITGNTCRKVCRQSNSFIESIGMQRLGMSQCSSHGFDTSTSHIVERILFCQWPTGSLRVRTQC